MDVPRCDAGEVGGSMTKNRVKRQRENHRAAAAKVKAAKQHADACVAAVEDHCGGEPFRVGELKDEVRRLRRDARLGAKA